MKIKFTFFLLVAIFCFSCSPLQQLEKRHYRNGFYIGKKKERAPIAVKRDSAFQQRTVLVAKQIESTPALEISQEASILSVCENVALEEKDHWVAKEIVPVVPAITIDLPKEPFNKKARAAQIFFVLAKLTVIAAFIVSLFSLLGTVFIIAGIAALFALLAMLFGTLAKKEIAAQPPYERELGEKEATHVIYRAMAGFASAVFILLLALLIEWIKRQ